MRRIFWQSLAGLAFFLGAHQPGYGAELRRDYRNLGYEGSLGAGVQFESNIDHIGFEPQPDLANSVHPGLRLSYVRPRLTLRGDAAYTWQHYYGLSLGASPYDRHALELRAGPEVSFSTGLRLSGQYLYLRSDDAVYNEIEGGSAFVVGRYRHQGSLLVGQSFGGSRSDTQVEYTFFKEGYRILRMQVLDRYTHVTQVRSKFQLRPKTALFGLLNVVGNVPVDKSAYPYSDKSVNVSLRPGIRSQWTQKISFSLSAGVSVWVFDTTTRVTPVVLADADYRPTALMQIAFSYEFATKDSITSSYFDLNRFVVSLNRRLSRSWDASAAVDYNWIQFGPPFPRTDHLIKPRAGITYNPVQLPMLALAAQYAYERRYAPEVYADLLRGRPLSLAGRNHSTAIDVTWSF